MLKTAIGIVFGVTSGFVVGSWLVNHLSLSGLRKWCARIESKQIDNEIRLDILEYNHLHEDGHLRVLFEDSEP